MKKITLIFMFLSFLASNSNAISLRLHVPMSTSSSECSFNNTTYSCEPSSTGSSLRVILGLLGVGYTSATYDHGFPSSSGFDTFKTSVNAFDISGSFLDGLVTIGVGSIISGNTEAKVSGSSGGFSFTQEISGGTHTGTTSFLNLGFDIGPIEIIGGYRMWDTSSTGEDIAFRVPSLPQANTDTTNTDSISTKFNQITVGVGIGF